MRSLVMVALVARAAAADGPVDWNGTYPGDGAGGGELCPHPKDGATLTVANSAFSIPWNIRAADDSLIRVGTLEGTVRPSGLATVTATLIEPMSPYLVNALDALEDTPDKLRALATDFHIRFEAHDRRREVSLASSGDCYASWKSDAAPSAPAAPSGPAAPASDAPVPPGKAPPPLPPGSSSWDEKYLRTSQYSADWRCPHGDSWKLITVAKGRFTFPYQIAASDDHGRDLGLFTVGQIDGSIAANGKVTVRTSVTVGELPPEVAQIRAEQEVSLRSLRAYTGTMALVRSGKVVTGTLTYGPDCEINFQNNSTFVPGRSGQRTSNGGSCHRDNQCESDSCEGGTCKAK